MTLPRRARMTLGALSTVLLFGMLGLAWWSWRHRPGRQPGARFRRARAGIVAAGLVIIAVGGVWRLTTAIQPTSACGLLYARANGAHVCWSRSADYYVAVHADNIAGARAMTLGDMVLTPGFGYTRKELTAVAGHEARHRVQWAVGDIIGGPLAFPVAYTIDDFFFPGSRNHFERQAGLESADTAIRAPGRC